MTFYPDTRSEIPKDKIPGYIHEKRIQTTDNETLQAFYFSHDDSLQRSLVIYFHGNAGNLYGRFNYANMLFNMGQNVLLVSYRGYSKSSGEPSEEGIYIDGGSAVKYAKEVLGYSLLEITIMGRSLGTTVAIHTAQQTLFKGVILITPLTSGKEMANAMGLKWINSVAEDSFNSSAKINRLQSPVLIVHGTDDEVIPYSMGASLYERYKGAKTMVTIDKAGHNDLQDIDPKKYWGSINEFLNDI